MRNRLIFVKGLTCGFLISGLLLGLAPISRAEKKEEGYYFALYGAENYVGEDFDGISVGDFEQSTTLCNFPKIEEDAGFGILIGGYNKNLAGELFYAVSKHDTSFAFSDYNGNGVCDTGEDVPLNKDGEVQVVGVNIKYYFVGLFNKNIRFFSQMGIILPRITLEKAAYKENDFSDRGDVIYTGYGLDLGVGVLVHLHPNLAINGAAVYRHLRIDKVEAFGEERVPSNSTYGSGRSYSVGVNYYF